MPWNFCTSASAIALAGENADSTITASGGTLARWSDDVEGYINTRTKRNWISSTASNNFSGSLAYASARLIAIPIITYNMAGFSSLQEATTMIDVYRDEAERTITELKDKAIQDEM